MGKGTMGDTIDCPWTMVVHLWYASGDFHQVFALLALLDFRYSPLTDLAVMCARRLESFALPAPSLSLVKCLYR